MKGKNFEEVVQLIAKEDTRYDVAVYSFIRQALDHTLKSIRESEKTRKNRHVTGQELCEGIRAFSIEHYGPMTHTLLDTWGVKKTEDFGQIVFNLVEYGVFGKTEQDNQEDFKEVYSFQEAFIEPFLPPSQKANS